MLSGAFTSFRSVIGAMTDALTYAESIRVGDVASINDTLGVSDSVEARASEFSAMTQRIAAEITGEAEYARLTIADKQNEAQARSDAVRAALSQMQSIAQLTVARHEAVARTAAQLAAASLSGIGVSATISGSSSNSTQWNKSAGFEGAGTVSW